MALYIQTNVSSLESQKNLVKNQTALMKSFNKLSSGYRINTASDDAAGLAISESMKSQIRSFTVAERNAADGISMAQTAEGGLGEVHDVLGRMRELSMQSANGSMTSTDRSYLQQEFSLLQKEIGRIQQSTKFNSKSLINATAATITYQVGLAAVSSDQISVTFGGVALTTVTASGTTISGATNSSALTSLSAIDTAIANVSSSRSKFGAAMNRLEVATSNIQTMRLNISAANSRIRDVDVASETAAMTRNQVLSQAGISVLAQANQLPQQAFGLIGR
ncbi:MAG: flagellin FliC [Deltaproteobacteria bacterium]|nr:flagellin FliC [Deltaproteobacteria bacterium]